MVDPSRLRVVCPRCRDRLWRRRQGQWSLRAEMLKLLDDGSWVAVCRCATEVPVPWHVLQITDHSARAGVGVPFNAPEVVRAR